MSYCLELWVIAGNLIELRNSNPSSPSESLGPRLPHAALAVLATYPF